jgi:TetR/AcrR family transcriptional regulator, mexJK operon transcriptional repressor
MNGKLGDRACDTTGTTAPVALHESLRGRPTAARIEAINHAIIQTAHKHFLKIGYDAASMEGIAADAKVSKATLYSRFPNKDAMLHGVIEYQILLWSHQANILDLSDLPLPARLHHVARIVIATAPESRAFAALSGATGARAEVAKVLLVGHRRIVDRTTREIIEGTRDDGHPPPRDPRHIAKMLMSLIYGWFQHEPIIDDELCEQSAQFIDRAIEVMMGGRETW